MEKTALGFINEVLDYVIGEDNVERYWNRSIPDFPFGVWFRGLKWSPSSRQ